MIYAIKHKEYIYNDDRLSWKAKGIFAYLQAKLDMFGHGNVSIVQLQRKSQAGYTAVKNGLKELIQFGYLEERK